MPEPNPPASRIAPTVVIVLASAVLILGVGRCGFLEPAVHGGNDYGISGVFFLFTGFILLVAGLILLARRLQSRQHGEKHD